MRHGLIDRQQFADACALWAGGDQARSLADLLLERGWLSSDGRARVDALLERERTQTIVDNSHDELPKEARATTGELTPSDQGATMTMLAPADFIPKLHAKSSPSSLGAGASVGGMGFVPDREGGFSVRERLELRDLHSMGGIGEVWRAYDQIIGREVALKRLRPDRAGHEASRARFFREAKITGQLEHPGIVPVYDYSASPDGSHCFYTMRFLRGRTLREVVIDFHASRIRNGHAMVGGDLLALLGAFVSVCNTIAFAHTRRIIHRDLKGDNVILGDFGEVVVLDWGLAKQLGSGHEDERPRASKRFDDHRAGETVDGERLGTPSYMAPEQARGDLSCVDERTDVYGLAAILYEILTGLPPFPGESAAAVMAAVIEHPPQPPRRHVSDIPAPLEAACMRGLSKDPSARQRGAAELGAQVQGWINALAERTRSEQERERFFDLSLDLLALVDRRGRLVQSNAAWETILGSNEQARSGAALLDFVAEDDHTMVELALAAVWSGTSHQGFEIRMYDESGKRRWIDWYARSLPDQQVLYLVGRDVSERKESEQEFQGLVESAPDPSCVIDERGNIVLVNGGLERMFGYSREELLGEGVEILVPEHLRARHHEHVTRYATAPAVRPMGSGLDLQGQHKDGTIFRVEISLSPVRTDGRTLIACSLRDVDARHRRERVFMSILEAAPDAMLAVDREQRVVYANGRMEAVFGYERAELVGQPLELLIPEAARARHREHITRYASDPQVRSMGASRTLFGRHKDGSEVPIDVSLSPAKTEDGLLIAAAIRVRDCTPQ
ncbi:PAS domain S-box protein [Pseudenhygromyxa sp. WMMC2535]|uniref:PAS domain S-box protein n=1 Tax=Pseudenhygromyxa sp. WMMC2535 TaxID=2712867 RepID=UPI00155730E2|nr:PAS domain S-box protein [Pseudenhygromyxa sp. WMMC2535]NVB37685.1 PAS domain S-box protein [Pseudenhygromyxa sp. WMMC2535]